MNKLSAPEVLAMLAKKHDGDVFVAECKDGPSQTRAHRRLDAWCLLKTWSPITTIGYEVKVARSDWRRDEKLHDYMPLCHLLYVVAPKGVVPAEELPAGVGLMEPVGESGRLITRRKAARREVALPAELMVYVLMCRSKITRERGYESATERNWRTEQLREWVNGKEDRRALSYAVSKKIQAVFDDQESRLRAIERRNEELSRIESRIIELGFDPANPATSWQVDARLKALTAIIDPWMLTEMEKIAQRLLGTREKLQQLIEPPVSRSA